HVRRRPRGRQRRVRRRDLLHPVPIRPGLLRRGLFRRGLFRRGRGGFRQRLVRRDLIAVRSGGRIAVRFGRIVVRRGVLVVRRGRLGRVGGDRQRDRGRVLRRLVLAGQRLDQLLHRGTFRRVL